jgi:hypothetical protein
MRRWHPSAAVLLLLVACSSERSGAPRRSGPVADAATDARAAECSEPGVLCYEFGPIDVPPGGEWQGFQAIDVGNTEDRAIIGMEIAQVGATSHHFIVALWNGSGAPPLGGPYDLTSQEGLGFVESTLGDTLVGSVFRYVRIDTGNYVGVSLPAGSFLVNNGHYINPGETKTTGLTRVMIRTAPKSEVRFTTINALPGNNAIDVPPGATKSVEGTWEPPTDAAVLLVTSHMHRHGKLFEAWKTVGGVETKFYSTSSYDSPPLDLYTGTRGDPPIVLRKANGDHLRFDCTYTNDDLAVDLTYGPSAFTNEMCILPVYYVSEPDALLALMASADGGAALSWQVVPNGAPK